jgi:glycerophosphoryl diester phosphodiesterase
MGVAWLTARPIAHRGYHDANAGIVENTLSAARAAIAKNFAIECDLQLTADGEAVLFHDDSLDRLTLASGPARARPLAELKTIPLRDTGDRIPTLGELLAAVAGRTPLLIELKSDWTGDRRLETEVARVLSAYQGHAAVMSFDPASMRAMRRLLPHIPRGLTADAFADGPDWGHLSPARRFGLRHLFATIELRLAFVSYGIHDLPAPAPLLLRRLGIDLICWTVRTPAEWDKARRYCDQITFEDFDPDAIVGAGTDA